MAKRPRIEIEPCDQKTFWRVTGELLRQDPKAAQVLYAMIVRMQPGWTPVRIEPGRHRPYRHNTIRVADHRRSVGSWPC
jgi:hypothetical protein